jgi:hypothetical protein
MASHELFFSFGARTDAMKTITERILPSDWIADKPYTRISSVDLKYIKYANELLDLFVEVQDRVQFLQELESYDSFKKLACFLVGYLEDKASNLGLFNTFTRLHEEMYGKPLPFYTLGEEYDPELLNKEDLNFLLWYFTNAEIDDRFFGPMNPDFEAMAQILFNQMELYWEDAPENKELLKEMWLTNPQNMDYYQLRFEVQKLMLSGYLFLPDFKRAWKEGTTQIIEKTPDLAESKRLVQNLTEDMVGWQHTQLLALTSWTWAKEFYRQWHDDADQLFDFQGRATGIFTLGKQSGDFVCLTEISTGTELSVLQDTMPKLKATEEGELICMGIAMYRGLWHFSGMLIEKPTKPFVRDFYKKDQLTTRIQRILPDVAAKMEEIQAKKIAVFQKFGPKSPLIFLSSSDFPAFHEKMAQLALIDGEIEETAQNQYKEPETTWAEGDRGYMVFMNPVRGIEFKKGSYPCIPDPKNPEYDPDCPMEASITQLLLQKETSTELCHYILNTYKKEFSFPESITYRSYMENLDFVFRFTKRDNYRSYPNVSVINSELINKYLDAVHKSM